MADERTKALSKLRGTEAARAPAREEAKSRIQKLASTVGNEEIAKRIENGNATRDQMLAFITERLQLTREMQLRELALTQKGAHFAWWRDVSDGREVGVTEPAPARWNAVAQAYEAALQALCGGDLKRGKDLLEEAHKVEQETTDQTTKLVELREIDRAAEIDLGTFAALVAQTPTSGAAAEPVELRTLIDAIVHVEQTVPTVPGRHGRRDPWWTLEEEEEEEDKPDGERS